MTNSLFDRISLAVLATLAVTAADQALAQSVDPRRIEDLEKENAAMRARIRRLEVQQENTSLRARLDQLENRGRGPQREAAPASPPVAVVATTASGTERRELVLADMSVKAPPALLPRYYNWTGFYIGGNIGYSVGSDR